MVRREGLLVDLRRRPHDGHVRLLPRLCAFEGLDSEAIRRCFREDPDCRQLLIALETGTVEETDFDETLAELERLLRVSMR